MPVRILIAVLLPAPFSPTSAWISPARNSSETSSSARTAGNDFEMCRSSSISLKVGRDRWARRGEKACDAHGGPSGPALPSNYIASHISFWRQEVFCFQVGHDRAGHRLDA